MILTQSKHGKILWKSYYTRLMAVSVSFPMTQFLVYLYFVYLLSWLFFLLFLFLFLFFYFFFTLPVQLARVLYLTRFFFFFTLPERTSRVLYLTRYSAGAAAESCISLIISGCQEKIFFWQHAFFTYFLSSNFDQNWSK